MDKIVFTSCVPIANNLLYDCNQLVANLANNEASLVNCQHNVSITNT